jgi:hypothetical protein
MFGLLSLAPDRAPSLLSVPIDCHISVRRASVCSSLHCFDVFNHIHVAQLKIGATKGILMSTPIKTIHTKEKAQPSKPAPQAKIAAKPQPTGLSREELRQIVLEMIG